jgi:hypothetical protein
MDNILADERRFRYCTVFIFELTIAPNVIVSFGIVKERKGIKNIQI